MNTLPGLIGSAGSTGTDGVDTIVGLWGNNMVGTTLIGAATLTTLDRINGGLGQNTLNVSIQDGASSLTGVNSTNIQTVNVKSSAAATVDSTAGFTGVTALNLTQTVGNAAVTAATTTDVSVAGVSAGTTTINGGKNITVTDTAVDQAISIGGTTLNAGTITVTDSKQGTGTIAIDGGTSATLTAGSTTVGAAGAIAVGNIVVGSAAAKAATGATTITQNLVSDGTFALTGGTIGVIAGTSANVTVNASSAAKTETSNAATSIGAITVTSGGTTTDVTVKETSAVTLNTKAAVAVVKETSTVTFNAIKSGEALTFNGLTFTAAKDLTAAQAAAAFANLTAIDTQSATGVTANGIYSGTFNTAVWTSAAVSGTAVVFTASDENQTDLAFTGTAATNDSAARVPTQVKVAGTAAVAAIKSTNAITMSAVRVDDVAVATIKNVTVDGYASADLGNTGLDLNALTTLSLANSGGVANVGTNAATLGLTVNNVKHAVSLDLTGTPAKTLNVTTTGADSAFALTAAGVEALTIGGTKAVDLTGSALGAMKTVVVKDTAGATIDLSAAASLTSVNTTATTGTVTAKLDAGVGKASYTGGAGVDNVTLTAAAPAKDIKLGDGDDMLTLATGTTSSTATLSGGNGTDTLAMAMAMAMANAITVSGGTGFQNAFDGFEKFQVNGVAAGAAGTVDMANLDNINYVINNQLATVVAVSEVQTLVVGGVATGPYSFLGTVVAGSGAADSDVTAANKISFDSATIIAAWNIANPLRELLSISNVGTTVTLTYALTEGDVANTTAAISGGITFAASAQTTMGVASSTGSGLLTIDHLISGGTVELAAAGAGATVKVTDALTGTADVLNVVTKVGTADLNHGTVTAVDVETVNITATDTNTTAGINKSTLALAATSVTTVTTVTVKGNAAVDLTMTGNTKVTLIDGTDGGALNVTSANVTDAVTIKGGAGADVLVSAATSVMADTLMGGAGNDSLTPNKGLTLMYGGAGADSFNITVASANANSPSTIMDIGSGDTIKFAGATSFKQAQVTLDPAGNPNLTSYADAAIDAIAEGQMAWFQYGGNTYIVQEDAVAVGHANGSTFINGTDFIVKITGLVNLGTGASYNDSNILEIS